MIKQFLPTETNIIGIEYRLYFTWNYMTIVKLLSYDTHEFSFYSLQTNFFMVSYMIAWVLLWWRKCLLWELCLYIKSEILNKQWQNWRLQHFLYIIIIKYLHWKMPVYIVVTVRATNLTSVIVVIHKTIAIWGKFSSVIQREWRLSPSFLCDFITLDWVFLYKKINKRNKKIFKRRAAHTE